MNQESFQSRYWDGIAERSAKVIMTPRATKELKGFLDFADLRKGMRVLDVGCGVGQLVILLLEMGHEVTGTEISARSLETLYSSAKQRNLSDKLVLKKTNLEEPVFQEEFDLALCCRVVHHFDPAKSDKIIANIVRSLRPGGRIVLFEPNGYSPFFLIHISYWCLLLMVGAQNRIRWPIERGILRSNLKGLKRTLLQSGIENIEEKRYTAVPLRLGAILEPFDRINEELAKISLFKSLSPYIWLKGNKRRNL